MWIPKSRQLGTPDTIPLHPQTAGRNPDIMLTWIIRGVGRVVVS
jgi:hypothetical protein